MIKISYLVTDCHLNFFIISCYMSYLVGRYIIFSVCFLDLSCWSLDLWSLLEIFHVQTTSCVAKHELRKSMCFLVFCGVVIY
jgi:hypothetical protein